MAAELLDIQINIGANTEDLGTELQKAENLLKKLQNALKRSTDVGDIQKLNTKISSVESSIGVLNSRMGGLAQPTSDATNALSNLSRVAQDAPYGFIGIANNLNPLLESFQRLQKESGSSTNALSAMVAGLTGPAGIGLALGVVSSLAITYGKQIAAFFNGPTEKLKTFREELKKLNEDIYKIVGEAQSTRTVGLNLVEVITGGNPKKQQEALKRLQSLYSDNKAIKDATIKNDKEYLTHLVNVASIQQDAAGKEKNTEQILSAAYEKRRKLEAQRDSDLKKVKTEFGGSAGYNKDKADKEKKKINDQYNLLIDDLDKTINKAKSKNLELINTLTNIETPDNKTSSNKKEKKDPFAEITKSFEKDLKAQETLRSKSIIDQQTYLDNVYKIYEDYIKKLAELDTKKATDKIENLLPTFDKMTFDKNSKVIKDGIKEMLAAYPQQKMDVPVDTYANSQKKLEEERNKYGTFFLKILEKKTSDKYKKETKDIEDLNKSYEDFAKTISQTVTGALFGMFDAMQQGLSFGDALGEMFSRLARSIAESVIQAAVFAGILSLISGGASGGGLSFGKAFAKVLGLADGGIATGPTLAMIGEGSESEAVLPLSKLGNMMQSSFNAGSMSNNSGGGSGQFVLRGQDLLLSVNRAQKASNLKGQNISLA
jgi:hypothetical protein